ncbi:MAG: DUF4262 domain-containing protein [Deltaproteobacteria bacterium]|nr:DUF4262 domain-containing protein [Deltaproteobacteria bacterium]
MVTGKKDMHALYVGDDRERLAALRQKDPDANLAERWEKIVDARPDLAERRLAYVPLIAEHGWAVIAIPEEGFAYTVGLKYRFDQPELLVAAPGLSPQELKGILNAIATYVALGNRIGPGEPVDLADFGVSLTFAPYSHDVFENKYATGYLATFERFFEDVEHETGDTLPVLWTELAVVKRPRKAKKAARTKRAAKKPTKKAARPKKPAPKRPATKKKPAAKKKPATKRPATKKAAARSSAKKTSRRR